MNSSKIYKSIIYQTKETQTGTATILVNEGTGDNVIAIYPGANMTMSSDEITIQKEAIINSDVILLQLETNYTALQQAITLAQKNSIPVIINPAPYNDIVNELIQDVDYITPNETEAGLLSGIDVHDLESAKRAAEAIHNKGVKNTVITLGSKGSLAFDGKNSFIRQRFQRSLKIRQEPGMLLTALWHQDLRKENHWNQHCVMPAPLHPGGGDKQCFRHA